MARFTDITIRDTHPATFDLSRYHSLEHPIWSCHDRLSHGRLWWSYTGEGMLVGALVGEPWRLILCPLGMHLMLPTLDLEGHLFGTVCAWCTRTVRLGNIVIMAERVLVCGDRDWTCARCIGRLMTSLGLDAVVIEGEARGADRMARIAAIGRGLSVDRYPALWNTYGPAAGPIRNRQMLVDGKPTRIVAFHNDIESSRGTKNMVEQGRRAGLPVEIWVCSCA